MTAESRSGSSSHLISIVVSVYFLSTWIQMPIDATDLAGAPHWSKGRIALAWPMVLSGDSPHYLAAAVSLAEDRDFDLSNNYRQASQGGRDLGQRFRGRSIDHHADEDLEGRLIPTHSPFFALILGIFALPFAGTAWMEPVLIWLSMGAGLYALWWLARSTSGTWWVLALAFATPYWAYSRDIWSEVWVASLWLILIHSRNPRVQFAAGLAGTLIKYPFVVVPLAMGVIALVNGEKKKGVHLLSGAGIGLASVLAMVQWLFRDVDHFNLFHSGIHGGFDFPFDGMIGLLLSPQNGLLFFCPFLIWCWRPLWQNRQVLFPVLAFFIVHAAYSDWMGGTGFAARYLVPVLPIAVYHLSKAQPDSRIFKVALVYSGCWGVIGGLAPALVYDRSPWGVVIHVVEAIAGGSGV